MLWDLIPLTILVFVVIKYGRRFLHFDRKVMRNNTAEYLADYHKDKKPSR